MQVDAPQLVSRRRLCHCSPPRTTSTQGDHHLSHSGGTFMTAAVRWLGWACLAITAAAGAAARPHGRCSDPAAFNYDPLSPVTAAAMFNNSGCLYSCRVLCSYFGIDCASTLCLIDTGADANWTNSNSTLYASLGTSLIVQGRVDRAGESPEGRTRLRRRIESTSTGGATVILVQPLHTAHPFLQHAPVRGDCCD